MRSVTSVFLHELRARRWVLLLAIALAALALLLPLLPGFEGQQPNDVRESSAAILMLALGYGLAVALGVTLFGSDLSEQRLGFFFSRPVSGWSIWVGRFAAAFCLMMLAQLILLVPLVAAGGRIEIVFSLGWWALPVFVIGPGMTLLLAHALSVMARDRSPWLVLDLVAATAAGATCWLAVRPVHQSCSIEAAWAVAAAFGLVLLAGLFLAGAIGVGSGRTDLRRSHVALSLTLWLVVAAGWAGAATFARWLDHFGPSQLSRVQNLDLSDPTGSWVVVSGRAGSRLDTFRRFLVSADGGTHLALRHEDHWANWFNQRFAFSASGTVFAWLGGGRVEENRTVFWVDLEGRPLQPVATTITVNSWHDIALSPTGGRLLLRDYDGLVSVYDFRDDRLLATARVAEDQDDHPACAFVSEKLVRCYTGRSHDSHLTSFRIHELDVAAGELRLAAELDHASEHSWPLFSPFSPQLLVPAGCPDEDCRLQFLDPVTASIDREVPLPTGTSEATLLSDGRVVAVEGTVVEARAVVVQNEDAGGWTRYAFDGPAFPTIGSEVEPGSLAIFTGEFSDGDERFWSCSQVEVLDLASGKRQALVPCSGGRMECRDLQFGFWGNRVPTAWHPQAWRYFLDDRSALVRWDPDSGSITSVAGGG